MAGAGVALYMSPMGVATNPAVLAFGGRDIYISAALFNPNREYTVKGDPTPPNMADFNGDGQPDVFGLLPGKVESDKPLFVVPAAAINLALPGGNALGLALYGNGGMNTEYPTATFFGSSPTGVNLEQLFVVGTVAKKFGDQHSLGVSGIFAFQRFKAYGLEAFQGFSSDPSKLTNNGNSTATGFGARIGYLGDFGMLSIGASYQTKISMSEFEEYAGLFAGQGDFDIPATWVVGVALKATPILTIAADVQRVMYSDIPSVANPMDLVNNAPQVPTDPTDPTSLAPNPNFKPLGSDDAWGFGWEDMTVFKLGVQLKPLPGLALRAGFSTGGQPIPDSEVLFNILAPGVIEQHFTLGFSKVLLPTVTLNVAGMYAPSKSVEGKNPMEISGQTIELKMNQFEVEAGVLISLP
ncbi:MAG: hypothetical protein D6732_04675 [Methanobacteriota archaeon]|nr:MAG: hypothetical protein D6732_04675 [Euryarchaeota archaeon]